MWTKQGPSKNTGTVKTKQNSKVTRQVFTNQNDLGEHIHSILGQCYEI